jgi:hypothetical protein
MSSVERLVPARGMSPAGFTLLSAIRSTRRPARALHDAVTAGHISLSDLPEIVANIWTWNDSPTSDLSEAGWLEIFRQIGFFSYPPLVVRESGGSRTALRPRSPLTLYRGSTAERLTRMSWATDRTVAQELW